MTHLLLHLHLHIPTHKVHPPLGLPQPYPLPDLLVLLPLVLLRLAVVALATAGPAETLVSVVPQVVTVVSWTRGNHRQIQVHTLVK